MLSVLLGGKLWFTCNALVLNITPKRFRENSSTADFCTVEKLLEWHRQTRSFGSIFSLKCEKRTYRRSAQWAVTSSCEKFPHWSSGIEKWGKISCVFWSNHWRPLHCSKWRCERDWSHIHGYFHQNPDFRQRRRARVVSKSWTWNDGALVFICLFCCSQKFTIITSICCFCTCSFFIQKWLGLTIHSSCFTDEPRIESWFVRFIIKSNGRTEESLKEHVLERIRKKYSKIQLSTVAVVEKSIKSFSPYSRYMLSGIIDNIELFWNLFLCIMVCFRPHVFNDFAVIIDCFTWLLADGLKLSSPRISFRDNVPRLFNWNLVNGMLANSTKTKTVFFEGSFHFECGVDCLGNVSQHRKLGVKLSLNIRGTRLIS